MTQSASKEGCCNGVRYYRTRHSAIRQLKHRHTPDTYGYRVWTSCWLLMEYLKGLRLPHGLRVMEIGCGWGLASIYCAKQLQAAATCVDVDPEVFPFLLAHAELNQVRVTTLNRDYEDLTAEDLAGIDLLIGADICFWEEMPVALGDLIDRALAAGVGLILIADPGRSTFDQLAAWAQARHGGATNRFYTRQPHPIGGRILRIGH